jgi:hypothetical protein
MVMLLFKIPESRESSFGSDPSVKYIFPQVSSKQTTFFILLSLYGSKKINFTQSIFIKKKPKF